LGSDKKRPFEKQRGCSFEEILKSRCVSILKHPGRANQKIMLFDHDDYIWVVPFVEENGIKFLKTLFPSRKYTKLFRRSSK